MIKLYLSVPWPPSQEVIRLAKQLGVIGFRGSVPKTPNPEIWEFRDLLNQRIMLEDAGLKMEVIEANPPMEKIILGLPGRDKQIKNFCQTLKNMGAADIKILAYHFMHLGWMRTSLAKPTRGNALTTAFDYELVKNAPYTEYGEISEEQMWDNWTYFIKRVIPYAEEADIKLALHPDDPPISPIRGIARPFRSVKAFKRVIETVDSDYNGLEFCQGCFAEMGVKIPETIRYFGKKNKIFYVHFRDVKGTPKRFEETFHDEGKTNMLDAIQAYKDIGFDGPMRPDHSPTMEGDERYMIGHPGYYMMGKIFAIGYIRGLIESVYGKKYSDLVKDLL